MVCDTEAADDGKKDGCDWVVLVKEVSSVVRLEENGSRFDCADLLDSSCNGNIGLPVAGKFLVNGFGVSVDGGSLEAEAVFGGRKIEVDEGLKKGVEALGVGWNDIEVGVNDWNSIEAGVVDEGS